MNALAVELRKEKRTGVIPVLLAVGILGAAYAFVNFIVRKDTLLGLPLPPMDVLLTQLYGMIMVLNMFGIVVAACMVYGKRRQKDVYAPHKRFGNVPLQVPDLIGHVPGGNRFAESGAYVDRYGGPAAGGV